MAKFYIVWNEGRNEGFITDLKADAKTVQRGVFRGAYTTAGAAFAECYDNDDLAVQEVDLDPSP